MSQNKLLLIISIFLVSWLLIEAANAQSWPDIPTAPRVDVPSHGVQVSIAAVYQSLLGITYIAIRERSIGSSGNWNGVYGHQIVYSPGEDPVQFIQRNLPSYNQFLINRYPPVGGGPSFPNDDAGRLNKTLYELFKLSINQLGQIELGPK